jgi:hypothetical protein
MKKLKILHCAFTTRKKKNIKKKFPISFHTHHFCMLYDMSWSFNDLELHQNDAGSRNWLS